MLEIRFYASAYDRINDCFYWSLRALVFLEAKIDHTFLHRVCVLVLVCGYVLLCILCMYSIQYCVGCYFFLFFAIYCEQIVKTIARTHNLHSNCLLFHLYLYRGREAVTYWIGRYQCVCFTRRKRSGKKRKSRWNANIISRKLLILNLGDWQQWFWLEQIKNKCIHKIATESGFSTLLLRRRLLTILFLFCAINRTD